MSNDWFVVVNPVSGARKGLKAWKKVKPILQQRSVPFTGRLTERDKHSTHLIERAIAEGYRKFICIGGDGTLHNVVNGIMMQTMVPSTDIVLLMVSVGTGNDWIKNHGIPKRIDKALDLIDIGKEFIQDVGRLTYQNNGTVSERFFHNFAGVGFDAFVVERTLDLKKVGQLAYTFGLARSLFQYNVQELNISADGRTYNEKMYMVLAGIGKYGGGGMKLTPDAEMDDGMLDVMMAKNLTRGEIIINAPRLFNGSFIHHKKVETFKTKVLSIESRKSPETVFLEADGELVGRGPFTIGLVERALKVLVP